MNLPTILIASVIFLMVAAIIVRGIYNRKHHRGGCSCGCDNCPGHGLCHPKS